MVFKEGEKSERKRGRERETENDEPNIDTGKQSKPTQGCYHGTAGRRGEKKPLDERMGKTREIQLSSRWNFNEPVPPRCIHQDEILLFSCSVVSLQRVRVLRQSECKRYACACACAERLPDVSDLCISCISSSFQT